MFVLHGSSSASFKMSATKNGEKCPSVPPSSPLCRPRYLTDSVHISYSNFLGSCSNLKFYECTLTSVRTASITNLLSTIFKDRIDILLSHYPQWEHELLIMASLFPFSRILWNFEIYVYTSTDVKVWIRYCPTAHNICHKSPTQTVSGSIFGDSTCRFKMLM